MGFKADIVQSIYDPGAVVGARGNRTLTEWQADAVMASIVPDSAVADTEPLILFFGTEQDRAEFVEVFKQVKPNTIAVPVVR